MAAGGGATNAGAQFQAQVAASAMAAMVTGPAPGNWISSLIDDQEIISVHCETDDQVDDVVAKTDKIELRIQAKTTLSLSSRDDSEFQKVMKQMHSDLTTSDDDLRLCLAVTTNCARTIRVVLRDLCDSARNNLSTLGTNPLSKEQKDVRSIVETCLARQNQQGSILGIDKLLRKLHVVPLDFASSGATLVSIRGTLAAAATSADTLWAALVSRGHHLAATRASVDSRGLHALVAPLVQPQSSTINDTDSRVGFELEHTDVPMGYEHLLAIQEGDGTAYIIEAPRFDLDGSKCYRFFDEDQVLASDGSGQQLTVVFRAGSLKAIKRLASRHPKPSVPCSRLVCQRLPTHHDNLNETDWAKAHSASCVERLKTLEDPFTCLACGDHVSDGGALLVEIDQENQGYEVGLVHGDCARPLHRVIGWQETQVGPLLGGFRNFDLETWVSAVARGQGLWNFLKESDAPEVLGFQWNPDNHTPGVGGWAAIYTNDSGEKLFHKLRGKVDRGDRETMTEFARLETSRIEAAKKSDDPLCIGSFGIAPLSAAVSQNNPSPSRLETCEAIEIPSKRAAENADCEEYYTPVMVLDEIQNPGSAYDDPISVLLTSATGLNDLRGNLANAGVYLPEALNSQVLLDDTEFDLFMNTAWRSCASVIVDPVWKPTGELVSGIRLSWPTGVPIVVPRE